MDQVPHDKRFTTIDEQITILRERGLSITNVDSTKSFLNRISYYKFSAYLKTFENDRTNHTYPKGTKIEEVIELVNFDSQLRTILFDALEEIEIAFKVKLVNEVTSFTQDNNWYEDSTLFDITADFNSADFLLDLRSKLPNPKGQEKFIKHYYLKYNPPEHPPVWMVMETLSLGKVSKMYDALKLKEQRSKVAWDMVRLIDSSFTTWMRHFTYLRNLCAHNCVVWNRLMDVRARIPSSSKGFIQDTESFFSDTDLRYAKVYASMCMLNHTLSTIKSETDFKAKVLKLLNDYPNVNLQLMGFTPSWKSEKIWI